MSIIEDFQSTTFAALPHEDLTVAEAWASSPLGDPTIEDGSLAEPVEFEDSVTAKPRSRGTNALVAGAVVAALGAVAGLGLLFIDGLSSKEQKPAVVVPNSSVGSVTPAPSAVAPPPVAPAPPSAATPPDAGHVSPAPVSGGDAPVVIVPAPATAAPPADPGAPPPPPNVTVNVPPVIVPVPIPVPVPPQHGGSQQGGSQQGGGQPAPSGTGHPPIQCFACHPPQPVQPQPIQPQPIHPRPLQHP
jgi:hypothetical protein